MTFSSVSLSQSPATNCTGLARRITQYIERRGRLPRAHSEAYVDEPAEHDAAIFDQLCATPIHGGAKLAGDYDRSP